MKKIRKMMKNKKGFTLIELMVVVIIVGILASVAVPLYTAHVKQAKASEGAALVGSVRTAELVYYAQHNTYTDDKTELGIDASANKYFTDYSFDGDVTATAFKAITTCDDDANLKVRIDQNGYLEWTKDGGTNWNPW
ncbi:MAG TPA: prepilin-type N-terminal cleavage/methylation domain-containing protein [bacterium]|nr:prepilin-type N-terminal cleavage/methylation domain-containing protein [bacterium]